MDLYARLGGKRVHDDHDWNWWDRLRGRIEAEWELISARADSASGSFRDRDHRDR